jgi:hypothetical protein
METLQFRRRHGWALPLLAALCGCGECGVLILSLQPKMSVAPEALLLPDLCAPTAEGVAISNAGPGALIIRSISLSGQGWSLVPPPLPLTLPHGDHVTLSLATQGGDGTLTILSNDPKWPTFTIPLHSTVNTPPVVAITAPTSGTVVAENADLTLTGALSDDTDPPSKLSILWSSSTSGPVSMTPAGNDGVATFLWPASGRMPGMQTITLTATDSCGASTSASVTFCQDATETYQPFDLQGWHYTGTTIYDTTNNWLQITSAAQHQEGSAFQTAMTVGGDHVDISFQFYCSDGTGADGFGLVALDTTRMTSFLGADGCGMAFGADESCSPGVGLPGWGIELDTYYNSEIDQTALNHTAIAFDGDLRNEPAWAALPDIRDSKWHQMTINVSAPHVTVSVDSVTYIDQDVSGNFNFPAYVGFTGSTGGETDAHLINSLNVTRHACSMTP